MCNDASQLPLHAMHDEYSRKEGRKAPLNSSLSESLTSERLSSYIQYMYTNCTLHLVKKLGFIQAQDSPLSNLCIKELQGALKLEPL